MQKLEESERCYIGIATKGTPKLHFFNGKELEPMNVQQVVYANKAAQLAEVGLYILRDYFERTENVNSAEALAGAFTDQFLARLGENEILFIEEFRIQDWLRVLRMLGEAA